MKKKLLLLFMLAFIGLSLGSCFNSKANTSTTRSFKDLLGRTVEIEDTPKRVCCIGSGALRLYSYIGDISLVCGAEDIERREGPGNPIRAYKMVYNDYLGKLPSCGNGGSNAVPDPEKLIECNPDIVISKILDVKLMNQLEQQINKPVVCISYGQNEAIDEDIIKSLELIGEIFHKEDRARELTSYIRGMIGELNTLTSDIPDSEKKSFYIGCYTKKGSQGFLSTNANYAMFDMANIKNVLAGSGLVGYQMLDEEFVFGSLNPDKIVIDGGGINNLRLEYKKNPKNFMALDAFKNGEVYLELPHNGYFTNLELAYANAYYCASIAYPNLAYFKEFNIEDKTREIIRMFLGKDIYDDIVKALGFTYSKINISSL